MIRIILLLAALGALLGGCSEQPAAAAPAACARLNGLAGQAENAAPVLAECLSTRSAGSELALKPGIYRLLSPIRIDRPVTIRTQGVATGARACAGIDRRCATLAIGQQSVGSGTENVMPIMIGAAGVTLDHLIVTGSRDRDRGYDTRICGNPKLRPLGGGMRILVAGFTLNRSVVRDVTCYTAIEVVGGVAGLTLTDNIIGPNGDHRPGEVWADGVTVHDARNAIVTGNMFVDNTDVQLIFGGCRDCRITGNRFRHDVAFRNGSFAELMIHAWPTTSGRYDGTIVSGNDIDCGRARNCGFGLIVGALPWYKAPTSGGTIRNNRVRNAKIGLNVDGLTGPVDIESNDITRSGGTFDSSCGVKTWPAVNIAPAARPFVSRAAHGTPVGNDSANCRPNTTPPP